MATASIEWAGRISVAGGIGRARRRMYKPERAPARHKSGIGLQPPVGCPDANANEVEKSIPIVCKQFGILPGRALGYDKQRDEYVVVGKTGRWALPQDYRVPGHLVAGLILNWRKVMREAGPQDPRAWLQKQGLIEQPGLVTEPRASARSPGTGAPQPKADTRPLLPGLG